MSPTTPAEITFRCDGCGSEVELAPGQNALQCPYCGLEKAIEESATATIHEHGLLEAIAQVPKAGGLAAMGAGREALTCEGCGAAELVDGHADRCAFCDSPLVRSQANDDIFAPQSILPFGIRKADAKAKFVGWLSSRWFAPSDLGTRARREGIAGVYLPYWTYDSATQTRYSGLRGQHYYVTESYEDASGNRRSRQVQRTRWYPAAGTVAVDFDDVLVCASRSLPEKLVDALEPWSLGQLKPFDPAFLSGFRAERYVVDVEAGFEKAESKMDPIIRNAVRADSGGDVQTIASTTTTHRDTTFKHTLLPLWISSFRYRQKVYRVLINAQTAEVVGERPYSVIKITLAVILGLLVAAGIYYVVEVA